MSEALKELKRKEEFNNNWSWGAEPAAAIPREPIEFYKANKNLDKAEAILSFTEEGKYYITLRNGTLIRNPVNNTALFNTASQVKDEYYKQLKDKELKEELIREHLTYCKVSDTSTVDLSSVREELQKRKEKLKKITGEV